MDHEFSPQIQLHHYISPLYHHYKSMESSDWQSNFVGTTVIDLDINADNPTGITDLPTWLREVLDRALFATGIKLKKKVASEDAIKCLQNVDLKDLKDMECAICFESYESRREKEKEVECDQKKEMDKVQHEGLLARNEEMVADFRRQYGVNHLQSMRSASTFDDPGIFMPSDESASFYARFPQRNLSTLEEASLEEQIPGYSGVEKINSESGKRFEKEKEEGHVPVKMPHCNHVFGRTCIIEWLESNVSCPLCRKEVEAIVENDPSVKRMNQIRESSSHVYNSDEDAVVNHLVNNSTDVFNPYRRPVDPYITPLTDSYMHQDWATPYPNPDNERDSTSREPSLILPRRFPFHEATSFPIHYPRRARAEAPRRDVINREQMLPRNEEPATPGSNRGPFTYFGISANEPRQRSEDPYDTQSSQSNTSSPRLGFSSGRGGPERSRRNNTGSGRSHPYTRPPMDD